MGAGLRLLFLEAGGEGGLGIGQLLLARPERDRCLFHREAPGLLGSRAQRLGSGLLVRGKADAGVRAGTGDTAVTGPEPRAGPRDATPKCGR